VIDDLVQAQMDLVRLRNEKEEAEMDLVRARFELQKMKTERDEALEINERLRDNLDAIIDRAVRIEGFYEEEAYAVRERDGVAEIIAAGWDVIRGAWNAVSGWEE